MPSDPTTTHYGGASQEAIRRHYDKGSDFFRPWLGDSLVYSCALWEDPTDTIHQAQMRKLDLLARWARVERGDRVLDVGCGWGGLMQRLVAEHGAREVVGLTLSPLQAEYLRERGLPSACVLLRNWADHHPLEAYDAVICLEACEHFARAGLGTEEKVAAYRAFFTRCHAMLKPGRALVLQTSAFALMTSEQIPAFIRERIWPESDLPSLGELLRAAHGLFDLRELVNHAPHYERTCAEWADRLERSSGEVIAASDEYTHADYVRYLRMSAAAFRTGGYALYRLRLRRVGG